MDTTTVMRNIAIMQEVITGKDYSECARQFNISVPTVSNSIRTVLRLLMEHTDIDVMESTNYSYILQKKEEIKKHLADRFPRTAITPTARMYLQKKYGKYYAREPEKKLAAEWPEIVKAFNPYSGKRELSSIQNWLASEGYMVGNVLTDEMLNFAWKIFEKKLNSVEDEGGPHSFVVKKVEQIAWKTKIIVHAEISQKDHKTIRRFCIDLIPT